MTVFGFDTTGAEVVREFRSQVDGRTFVITGASEKGLGAETALSLASDAFPRLLILVGRTPSLIEPVVAAIKQKNPSLAVRIVSLDLGSQKSVRSGAEEIGRIIDNEADGKLDVLINNAGVMVPPYQKTEDGLEIERAVGEISPRIVNLSSAGHRISPVRFDDLDFENGKAYKPWAGYGQSKAANVLFTRQLAKTLKSRKILAFTLHPGAIVSPLQRHMTTEVLEEMKAITKSGGGLRYKSLQQGCATTLTAALSPEIENESGAYLDDCQIGIAVEHATNKESAEKLWKLSEDIVGQKFPL